MFPQRLTDRLVIRDLEPNDGPRVFSYRRHPDVARFQSWGTESVDVIQTYIRRLASEEPGTAGKWYQVGIYVRASDKLIGDCGFRVPADNVEQVEIGITLARECQGNGYATEAMRALLNYLFVELRKHRVF